MGGKEKTMLMIHLRSLVNCLGAPVRLPLQMFWDDHFHCCQHQQWRWFRVQELVGQFVLCARKTSAESARQSSLWWISAMQGTPETRLYFLTTSFNMCRKLIKVSNKFSNCKMVKNPTTPQIALCLMLDVASILYLHLLSGISTLFYKCLCKALNSLPYIFLQSD